MISAQGAFNDQPVWREAAFDMHGDWPAPRGVRVRCLGGALAGFPGPASLTPLSLSKRRVRDNYILCFLVYSTNTLDRPRIRHDFYLILFRLLGSLVHQMASSKKIAIYRQHTIKISFDRVLLQF